MTQLTQDQLVENYQKLRRLVNDTFSGERLERLNEMYDFLEDRIIVAPASGKEHYHNAYVGGYVEHVLHVASLALKINKLWKENGAHINYTNEELVFAALHHDLGKVGDLEGEYYSPNDSDWHRKNQGLIFKHNDDIQYMTVTDRAIFLLNHFGVKMSKWEYIGLRLTDGMYEEANKSYYTGYIHATRLRSNIAYVLHQADMMATHLEYDKWEQGEEQSKQEVSKKVSNIKQAVQTETETKLTGDSPKDLFEELFGEKK